MSFFIPGLGQGGGNITIDNITGLRDELNKKGETLELTDTKLSLKSGTNELSNISIITSEEIQQILNNLR